jgi:hypothetical protein
MSTRISRRTVLKGLGTAIALPWLESMLPAVGEASTLAASTAPKRLGFVYVPNGIVMQNWTPAGQGAEFQLTRTLEPLQPFKDKMLVLTSLTCDKARPNGDGNGDHARAMSAFLTGAQPRKTEGANIRVGISVDQACASRIGHLTRFPSLELGIEEGRQVGRCDSGYSCAYSHNLSWRNESTPVVKDCDPQSVFDRLFGNGNARETAAARARRQRQHSSILDFAMEDARGLQSQLSMADQRKLEEYLTSIREIEVRIARGATETPATPPAGQERPPAMRGRSGQQRQNGQDEYPQHVRLMLDLFVLAWQGDLTRVITLPFANEGSNQTYSFAGAAVPHHETSHHMNNAEKLEHLTKINTFHTRQFAYLLNRLESIQEGNGTLLDNSMLVYGCGNSDSNRHNHDNLPILVVGRGGGTIRGGRHIRYRPETPLNNLWLGLLDRMGAPHARLGDGTGKLEGLS